VTVFLGGRLSLPAPVLSAGGSARLAGLGLGLGRFG
jgi:hypothetical protein